MKGRRVYGFLFASSLGTFLEFFDLALYSFCSAIIAKHFFPDGDSLLAILATWAIFAVSYLVRPLGAIWLGYLADVHSSRHAMVLSMAMMGIATTAMGLLPTYSQIGIFAPIILLLLRILQSVAVSPEYNLPSVFIKNNNWFKNHFGLVSSLSAAVTGLGMMSASWIMAKILNDISINDVPEYYWRLPFIFAGLLVGTVGIYFRWNMDDSLTKPTPKVGPLKLVFKLQRHDFLKATFLAGYIGCITYVLFSYLIYILGNLRAMPLGAALDVLGSASLILPIFSLLAGYCSDRIPRHILMLVAAIMIGASGYTLFSYIQIVSLTTVKIQCGIMLASLGFFAGSFPGYLAELFAKEYRYTGSFLAYNIGMSWIGGISPLLLIGLSKLNVMFPVIIVVIYSILVMLLVARPLVEFGTKRHGMV